MSDGEGSTALIIAFHFPPASGYSGVQRTLKFVRYLPEFGWNPVVLTAHPRAYARLDAAQLGEIPPGTPVHRAFALDAARHLAVGRRYPRFLALPDRWSSWRLGGVAAGWGMIRRYRPRVIFSTYPIATALQVAHDLHRLSGLPWVADFRDPMVLDPHPVDPAVRRAFLRLEPLAVQRADRVVTTTAGLAELLQHRNPQVSPERFRVIANGYDEEDFVGLAPAPPAEPGRVVLLHSGALYGGADERDPGPFFRALARLRERGGLPDPVRVVLRGAAAAESARAEGMIRALGLSEVVSAPPALPYRQALAEMLGAGGLLLFQGRRFDALIPAKLFEYLRGGRPILAMTGAGGESARVLAETGGGVVVSMEDEEAILRALPEFIARAGVAGPGGGAEPTLAARYERRHQAGALAALLREAADEAREGRLGAT
ncbi:MAG: glycosyltransferase [Magnetococcales bacterium]|nr:glycosyltransferase [Magnetococcales bacterium]